MGQRGVGLLQFVQSFHDLFFAHLLNRAVTNLCLVNVDVTLRLTPAVLSLHCRTERALLEGGIPNDLQISQVALVFHAVLLIKLLPILRMALHTWGEMGVG